jgi:hypothetical protein
MLISKGERSLTEYSKYLMKRDKNMSYRARVSTGKQPILDRYKNKKFHITTLKEMTDMRKIRLKAKQERA